MKGETSKDQQHFFFSGCFYLLEPTFFFFGDSAYPHFYLNSTVSLLISARSTSAALPAPLSSWLSVRKPPWCWSPWPHWSAHTPYCISWQIPKPQSLIPAAPPGHFCYQSAAKPKYPFYYCNLVYVVLELLHPPCQIGEGKSVSEVEDHKGPKRIFIESFIQSPKTFLTCRIPNLQHHNLIVNIDMLLAKLQPYRRIGTNIEFILDIPRYDIGLADATLPCIAITIPTSTNLTYFFSYLSASSSII